MPEAFLPKSSAGLLVLDLGELGVDDVLVLLRWLGLRLLRAALLGLRLGLRFGVHLLAELLRRLRQRLRLGVDLALVLGFERTLGFLERGFDLVLLGGVELVAVVLERLADRVHQRFALVARVYQLERLAVFLGVR